MKKMFLYTLLLPLCIALRTHAQPSKEILYVGTYSIRGSKGLYVFEFDRKSGKTRPIQSVENSKNPTFLAIHPSGKFLYTVNEGDSQGEKKSGSVNSYAIDSQTGKLTLINQQLSIGSGPCHISIDKAGHLAFVSNYGGGSVTVLPIQSDGSLKPASDYIQYTGSGINKQRQGKPHAHSATLSPDNRFVYVSDLGTDKIYIYEINTAQGKLNPAAMPYINVAAGAGPRHFTFHPNGHYAYLVEELTSTVGIFAVDSQTGALKLLEDQVKTLPESFTDANTSADSHIDPTGKFLYQSNRGLNALAIFSIASNGKLKLIGQQETLGKTPRNFMIDNQGEYVLVGNQDTDTIVIYKRDLSTGKLTPMGSPINVPAPVCLKMIALHSEEGHESKKNN